MNIYKRFGISNSFLDAIQTVTEKKALDPVDPKQAKGTFKDRKDKDIDNDGDVDKSDKYIHARRNAITKAMSEKKKGGKDKVDTEPKLDDKDGMRGVQEKQEAWPGTPEYRKKHDPNYNPYDPQGKERKKLKQTPYGYRGPSGAETKDKKAQKEEVEIDELNQMTLSRYAAKARAQSMDKNNPKRYKRGSGAAQAYDKLSRGDYSEEVEEIEELSKSTLGSYAKKAVSDVRFKQGLGKDYEALSKRKRDQNMKAALADAGRKYKMKAQDREAGVKKAIDRLAKEEAELTHEDIEFINQLNNGFK